MLENEKKWVIYSMSDSALLYACTEREWKVQKWLSGTHPPSQERREVSRGHTYTEAVRLIELVTTTLKIETLKRCLFQMQETAKDLVEQAKSLPPPQRTWVGLDLEEQSAMWDRAEKRQAYQGVPALAALIQEVEAKLKEKNA